MTPSSDRRRADARANRRNILEVAEPMLRADPDCTIDEIAAAAGISRATVYRHFKSRQGLAAEVRAFGNDQSETNATDALRPAGELAAGPVPLDVVDVLNKVPPHQLGDQIVAEAQRLAGVRSVALYLVDIDGTRLRRLAGSREFPEEIMLGLAVGPEIPREALVGLRDHVAEVLPNSVLAPMFLRGRALGVLMAINAPEGPLLELARQAGAALALAEQYTDVFDAVRRRRDITAASEIQQNMLPPRISRIAGGILAGNVLPGYDTGGDWFDYVENPDGAWIAVADSTGKGTTAAAIGAIALGAFRAKRRRQASLTETILYMEQALHELEARKTFCNVIIARWHGPTAGFFWVACGDQQPLLITAEGRVLELNGTKHPALGKLREGRSAAADTHRLQPGERILMISQGVLTRAHKEGGELGLRAIRDVVERLDDLTAPNLVRSIEREVIRASEDLLEDDATIVAFAPTEG